MTFIFYSIPIILFFITVFHIRCKTNFSLFAFILSICSFTSFLSIANNDPLILILSDTILFASACYHIGLVIQYKDDWYANANWDMIPNNIQLRLKINFIFFIIYSVIYGLIFGF